MFPHFTCKVLTSPESHTQPAGWPYAYTSCLSYHTAMFLGSNLTSHCKARGRLLTSNAHCVPIMRQSLLGYYPHIYTSTGPSESSVTGKLWLSGFLTMGCGHFCHGCLCFSTSKKWRISLGLSVVHQWLNNTTSACMPSTTETSLPMKQLLYQENQLLQSPSLLFSTKSDPMVSTYLLQFTFCSHQRHFLSLPTLQRVENSLI
jgi:hypothetical protein